MKKLHVIYVTGLGDKGDDPQKQKTLVKTWRWYGVEPEFFQVNWGDKTPWEPKLQKLLSSIDNAYERGMAVGLVGASAGGSAVINAYAARRDKVAGVVLIAAKVNHPETVGKNYKRNNPAFVTSINNSPKALASLSAKERSHILSRYALFDEVVDKADSYVSGARNRRSPTFGHFITIGLQIIFGAPSFIRFLRRQVVDN